MLIFAIGGEERLRAGWMESRMGFELLISPFLDMVSRENGRTNGGHGMCEKIATNGAFTFPSTAERTKGMISYSARGFRASNTSCCF